MYKVKRNIVSYLLFIFVVLFFATACSSTKYINFYGESENWSITYRFRIDDFTSSVEEKIYIERKNHNEKIDYINYIVYENGDESVNSKGTPVDKNKYARRTVNTGVSKPNKEDKYIVEVEWNNQKETIKLNYKE